MASDSRNDLYWSGGSGDQIPDELAAYNPLIPQGRELIATVMFELRPNSTIKRPWFFGWNSEDTMYINVDGQRIRGDAETDVDRTSAEGKASSANLYTSSDFL